MTTNEHDEPDQSGPDSAAGPERCQFPGCTRPVPTRLGKGRPARYCAQTVLGTEHNRANALTRRRQLERVGVDAGRAVAEPVTVARATAGDLVTRLETAVREQSDLQASLLAALRTMDSPEQAAAQAAAATETARAEAATARAQAAAAQAQAEQAEATAAQAIADAEDADTEAASARADADAARAESDTARGELAAVIDQLTATTAQLERTRTDLTAQIGATEQAEADRSRLTEALQAEQTAHVTTRATRDDLRTELETVTATAQTAAAVAAERERSLTAQAVQLTAELDQTRAQVQQLHTDLRAADATASQQTARAERAEGEVSRLSDALQTAHTEHDSALSELGAMHEQLSQLRIDSATAAAIAATQLKAAQDDAARRIADLREEITALRSPKR